VWEGESGKVRRKKAAAAPFSIYRGINALRGALVLGVALSLLAQGAPSLHNLPAPAVPALAPLHSRESHPRCGLRLPRYCKAPAMEPMATGFVRRALIPRTRGTRGLVLRRASAECFWPSHKLPVQIHNFASTWRCYGLPIIFMEISRAEAQIALRASKLVPSFSPGQISRNSAACACPLAIPRLLFPRPKWLHRRRKTQTKSRSASVHVSPVAFDAAGCS
jgi:hypothetical protein